jgi:acetyltransferase-like isoleucine patch superfamily enzyme
VSIIAADSISTGDNCMFAACSYVSDADWHDLYDRTSAPGNTAPVRLGNNVWVGYGAIVGKGVSVGDNSIIGAGAVVVKDIPENVVAAGNPAKVVKKLDPKTGYRKREELFTGDIPYDEYIESFERYILSHNRFRDWLRSRIWPTREL